MPTPRTRFKRSEFEVYGEIELTARDVKRRASPRDLSQVRET